MTDFARLATDLSLRFEGTYVRYRQNVAVPWSVVYVAEVIPRSGGFPEMRLESRDGSLLARYNGTGEFNFEFPHIGNFNFQGTGYSFFRRPSRQNKRALCAPVFERNNFYTENKLLPTLPLNLWVAEAVFDPKFPTVEQALRTLENRDSYCVAISPEFLVGLNTTVSENHLLFHFLTPLAEISNTGEVVKVLHPLFQRTVNEYVARQF